MHLAHEPGVADLEFGSLLERVHEIGGDVVLAAAADVDRNARFPSEGFDALRGLKLLSAYVPASDARNANKNDLSSHSRVHSRWL